MPTVLNLNGAKTIFSSVIADVESQQVTVTFLRYGRPVAQIVPCRKKRDVSPMPELVGKVRLEGDWFADDSADWKNA